MTLCLRCTRDVRHAHTARDSVGRWVSLPGARRRVGTIDGLTGGNGATELECGARGSTEFERRNIIRLFAAATVLERFRLCV